MIILGLRLKNVRSYTDKTIVFPREGITVIYGDVGTGKSTILTSITYALFGQPKAKIPDPMERYAYPKGEDLLRIGAREGYVRLLIQQKNKIILIERGLRRKPDGKVSDPGGKLIVFQYVEENGEQKLKQVLNRYYSAEELKKKVLEVLGIPEITSKQKPLIFTKAIYVPQFSVNDVINLDDNERIQLINKALNIDKYNIIKTNLNKLSSQVLNYEIRNLKNLEQQYESLLGKTSIEELKEEINKRKIEIDKINKEIQRIEDSIKKLESKIKQYQEQLEKKHQELNNIQQKYGAIIDTEQKLLDKESRLKQLLIQFGISDSSQISIVSEKINKELEEIERQLKDLEQKKEELLKTREEHIQILNTINNKINKCNKKIGEIRGKIQGKEEKLRDKLTELREKEELLNKGICPVCKQRIPHEHGYKLVNSLKNEIEVIKQQISKLEQTLKLYMEELDKYEKEYNRIYEEVSRLEKQIMSIDRERNELMNKKIMLNNKLSKLSEIQTLLNEIEMLKQDIRDKELIEKQLADTKRSIDELKKTIDELNNKYKSLMNKKIELKEKRGKLEAEIKSFEQQIQQYREYMKKYHEYKKEREFLENMKKFLYGDRGKKGLFYELIDRVEERVRSTAYDKFRTLFIEYFLKLMEDHEILDVDLDEKFRPVFRIRTEKVSGIITQPSGGQLTSVSLAYRLALNAVARGMTPQLKHSTLILDEPTYGFSPERVEKLRELLMEISSGGKRQIIVVTHDRTLLSIGDCKIKLSIDPGFNETNITYEECTIPKEYKEFVENLLYKKTTHKTPLEKEEIRESKTGGFKPVFKRSSRGKSIFDFIK